MSAKHNNHVDLELASTQMDPTNASARVVELEEIAKVGSQHWFVRRYRSVCW